MMNEIRRCGRGFKIDTTLTDISVGCDSYLAMCSVNRSAM